MTTRTPACPSSRSRSSRSTRCGLEIVMLAHDLIVWTQALVLDGELAKAEPKRIRYRLLHVAGRLAFSGRRAKLHLQHTWPWAAELARRVREAQNARRRQRLTAATGPHTTKQDPPATAAITAARTPATQASRLRRTARPATITPDNVTLTTPDRRTRAARSLSRAYCTFRVSAAAPNVVENRCSRSGHRLNRPTRAVPPLGQR